MNPRKIALYLFVIVLASFFLGCISQPEKESESKPQINLEKISNIMIINPDSYQVIPVIAALVIDRKINLEINESGIIIEDISLFSSRVAITFWNKSEEVIVVDSYKNALLASSLSKFLNVPILIYGETTKQALVEINNKKVFLIGNVPIDGVKLSSYEIMDYQIEAAKNLNIDISYVVLVNSNDSFSMIPGLSSFGALLACYRNGLIFEVTNEICPEGAITEENASPLLEKVRLFYSMLDEKGINLEHVCIVGGADAIPQIINETVVERTFGWAGPSDNYWGDKDNNAWYPEYGVGRFIAANIEDAWKLLQRYLNYKSYLNQNQSNLIEKPWQDNAFLYVGHAALVPFTIPSSTKTTSIFLDAGFNLYLLCDPSPPLLASLVNDYAETSNLISFTDPGYEDASGSISIDFSEVNLQPCVFYHLSSLTGKITGDISVDFGPTYKAIHAGVASYIASTGVSNAAYRIPTDGPRLHEEGAPPLATSFFKHLTEDNLTVGLALKEAKINAMKEAAGINPKASYLDVGEAYQYTLYGDPAFNPYEPCNEGKSN